MSDHFRGQMFFVVDGRWVKSKESVESDEQAAQRTIEDMIKTKSALLQMFRMVAGVEESSPFTRDQLQYVANRVARRGKAG